MAVSVMLDPVATFALQVAASPPQSIPPPVTLPLPLTDTASGTVEPVPPENAAVTLRSTVIEIVHVDDVPVHAPPQPLKEPPEPGVAVSVTSELAGSFALRGTRAAWTGAVEATAYGSLADPPCCSAYLPAFPGTSETGPGVK